MVWLLVRRGDPEAKRLMDTILGEQDTDELWMWQHEAEKLAEEIEEVLRSRTDHYPQKGMSDVPYDEGFKKRMLDLYITSGGRWGWPLDDARNQVGE